MNFKSILVILCILAQSSFLKAQYYMTVSDFSESFKETSSPEHLICRNETGEKILVGHSRYTQLKIFLKDETEKTIISNSIEFSDGKVNATEITKFWENKRPCEIVLDSIDVIYFRRKWMIRWATPYYDMDSLKAVHASRMDSLENDYNSKERFILSFISLDSSEKDTIRILENACYNLKMANDRDIQYGVIRDISSDSISISTIFNPGRFPDSSSDKTSRYSIRDIKAINLLKGGGIGTKTILVDDYVIQIDDSPMDFRYAPCWFSISRTDGDINFYRLLLTENGFKGIRYEDGKYYWFEG